MCLICAIAVGNDQPLLESCLRVNKVTTQQIKDIFMLLKTYIGAVPPNDTMWRLSVSFFSYVYYTFNISLVNLNLVESKNVEI